MFEDTFDLDSFDVEAYADKSWDEYTEDKIGELDDKDCHDLED
jgi:hypothetical protein